MSNHNKCFLTSEDKNNTIKGIFDKKGSYQVLRYV